MKLNTQLTKTIQGFKVVPKEPAEVLVQRQLKGWLDPGWCMTAPAGSESKSLLHLVLNHINHLPLQLETRFGRGRPVQRIKQIENEC